MSGLAGLLHATRRATAVIGVDSGPPHLAAALGKPGVAIYGPTDPARHGPYGGTFTCCAAPARRLHTAEPASRIKYAPDRPRSSVRSGGVDSGGVEQTVTLTDECFPKGIRGCGPAASRYSRFCAGSGFRVVVATDPKIAGPGTSALPGRGAAASLGDGSLGKKSASGRSGPYAYVRNPLYLGTLLVAAGLAIAARRWLLAALFAIVFRLIYLPAIELEEEHLRNLFPNFAAYANAFPRFGQP